MKVFIVGGGRFIGAALVRRLMSAGHEVLLFNRSGKAPDAGPGNAAPRLIQGDRREPGALKEALQREAPEVVVDMVCMTEHDAQELVSATSARLVVPSSCDVYRNFGGLLQLESDPPDPVPLSEQSPLRTRLYPYRGGPREEQVPWIHDYDKILVERVVLPAGGCVLRLPMVFGPNDYQHRLYGYLKRMDDGRDFILLSREQGGWRACRGFVEDVAAALHAAVESPTSAGKLYNVAYPQAWTEAEWIRLLGDRVGWHGQVAMPAKLSGDLAPEGDFSYDISVDSTKARSDLNLSDTPIERALDATIKWERANPPADFPEPDYLAEDQALAAKP